MEIDKALDPVHVGLLRAQAVVLQAQSVTDLIEQFRLCVHPASIDKVYQPDARNGA